MNNLEEVDPADEPRTYRQAPFWRRLSVAVAGSAMHFLIACWCCSPCSSGPATTATTWHSPAAIPPSNPIVEIDGLSTGASPAQMAGFQLGDRIVAVDGQPVRQLGRREQLHPGPSGPALDVTVERHGQLAAPVPGAGQPQRRAAVRAGRPAGAGAGARRSGSSASAPSPVIHSSVVSRSAGPAGRGCTSRP